MQLLCAEARLLTVHAQAGACRVPPLVEALLHLRTHSLIHPFGNTAAIRRQASFPLH
jgi:hypothetical protein